MLVIKLTATFSISLKKEIFAIVTGQDLHPLCETNLLNFLPAAVFYNQFRYTAFIYIKNKRSLSQSSPLPPSIPEIQ